MDRMCTDDQRGKRGPTGPAGPGGPPGAPGAPGRPADDGVTILVADDDSDIAYLVGMMLSDAGYRVQEATHLQEVNARLARDPLPDLVVLDVKMGADDTTLLVARLRQVERTARLPVLLISARASVRTDAQDRATSGLSKPFTAQQLLEAVAQALATRQEEHAP